MCLNKAIIVVELVPRFLAPIIQSSQSSKAQSILPYIYRKIKRMDTDHTIRSLCLYLYLFWFADGGVFETPRGVSSGRTCARN